MYSDDSDDDWYVNDPDADEALEADLISCPECSADVYEDSPQCSVCGCWFSSEDRPPVRRGAPITLLIVALCLIILFMQMV